MKEEQITRAEGSFATYCPEDDKLRLYVGRVPREEYEALRKEGWTSTPKQAETSGCNFAAVWTPERENTALIYGGGTIEDEDTDPQTRAADRAERFAGYRDKRTGEATGKADDFDSRPTLHGYQSAALAERRARAHDRIGDGAVTLWNKAEYWQSRTAGVIRNALHKAAPGVRMGRIKVLEAQARKTEKEGKYNVHERQQTWDAWKRIVDGLDIPRLKSLGFTLENAGLKPAGADGDWTQEQIKTGFAVALSEYGTETREKLISGTMTAETAAAEWMQEQGDRPSDWTPGRWHNHITLRLSYETQMLEAQGGRAASVDMIPGGWIGKSQIMKVNKSTTTGRVVSVAVKVPAVTGWAYKIQNVPGTDYALMTIDTERMGKEVYRAPTEEELTAFADSQKADKKAKAAATPKTPPLINPTDEDAQRLQDIWNAEANRRPSYTTTDKGKPVLRMTQERYKTFSAGGNYAQAETLFVKANGDENHEQYRGNCQEGAAFKVRIAGYSPRQVIILTDKPQKPLPLETCEDLKLEA